MARVFHEVRQKSKKEREDSMAAPVLIATIALNMSAKTRGAVVVSRDLQERIDKEVAHALQRVHEATNHGFLKALHYFECSLAVSRPDLEHDNTGKDARVLEHVLAELARFGYKASWQWSERTRGTILITIEW